HRNPVRAITMTRIARNLLARAALLSMLAFASIAAQTTTAAAQSPSPTSSPSPSPTPTPTPSPSPSPSPTADPPSDGGASGKSISGLAGQRFNQMITNQVLGSV